MSSDTPAKEPPDHPRYCKGEVYNVEPPKLTDEVAATIVESIRAGAFYVEAARAAGVDRHTVGNWRRWGKKGIAEGKDNRYTRFETELDKAEAEANINDFAAIAADPHWQARQYRLAIRDRETYGIRTRVQHEFELAHAKLMELVEKVLGPDAVIKLSEAIAAADSAGADTEESGGTEGPEGDCPTEPTS